MSLCSWVERLGDHNREFSKFPLVCDVYVFYEISKKWQSSFWRVCQFLPTSSEINWDLMKTRFKFIVWLSVFKHLQLFTSEKIAYIFRKYNKLDTVFRYLVLIHYNDGPKKKQLHPKIIVWVPIFLMTRAKYSKEYMVQIWGKKVFYMLCYYPFHA